MGGCFVGVRVYTGGVKEVKSMTNDSLQLWAAVLLFVGGLVHAIPALYTGLAGLTGGLPWVQIIVGILSIIVSLVLFSGDRENMNDKDSEE